MMSLTLLLSLLGVFVSVALLTGSAASAVIASSSSERKRLRRATALPRRSIVPDMLPIASIAAPRGGWVRIATLLPRSDKEMERLRLRLVRAGVRSPAAAIVFTLVELFAPVVVGAVPLLFLNGLLAWFAAAAAALLAFFVPGLLLERQLRIRRREIEDGLPDALDLIVVCIEAGSSLDQAIVKTSEEFGIAYRALGEELRLLITEIRAGKPRIEALKNLAKRTKVDEVASLVSMLIQTDRVGTSVGQALRTHADTSRTKRRQRAEEQAQKIGVKLVFPLVLFFFPALYVVLLGPAIIQFIRNL
jgi:tight adherence protein C